MFTPRWNHNRLKSSNQQENFPLQNIGVPAFLTGHRSGCDAELNTPAEEPGILGRWNEFG